MISLRILILTCGLVVFQGCNEFDELKQINQQKVVHLRYNAFPDVTMTNDGKLICVFYNGWHHESVPVRGEALLSNGGRIMITQSSDSAKTWTLSQVLLDTELDDRDPSIVQLTDGRLLCNYFGYSRDETVTASVFTIESDDSGETWSSPLLIAKNHATSSPVRDIGGGVLGLVSYSIKGGCFLIRSFDQGGTWEAPIQIVNNQNNDFTEPDLVKINNRLLVVMRSDSKNMHSTESIDFGLTWEPLRDLGFPGAAPYLLNHSNEILILGHRIPTTSIKVSATQNISWSSNIIIDESINANGAYPSIVAVGENEFIISYYFEEVKNSKSSIFFKKVIIDPASGQLTVSDVLSRIDFEETKSL